MKNYGWINLLKTIAATKIFDLPGRNSISSVRATSAFDVLLYASEDKEYNDSQALDLETNNKT